jgi:hypothetical protein
MTERVNIILSDITRHDRFSELGKRLQKNYRVVTDRCQFSELKFLIRKNASLIIIPTEKSFWAAEGLIFPKQSMSDQSKIKPWKLGFLIPVLLVFAYDIAMLMRTIRMIVLH